MSLIRRAGQLAFVGGVGLTTFQAGASHQATASANAHRIVASQTANRIVAATEIKEAQSEEAQGQEHKKTAEQEGKGCRLQALGRSY